MNQHAYLVGLIAPAAEYPLSSELQRREAERHQLLYLCRHLRGERGFGALLDECRAFGFSGLSVATTVARPPADGLDGLSRSAARTGTVTTVVFGTDGRAVGHDAAMEAFTSAFGRSLPGARLSRVVQVGATGAGVSVAHALAERGVEHLTLVDTDQARASALAAAVNRHAEGRPAEAGTVDALDHHLKQADGLVNAPPSGGSSDRLTRTLVESLRSDLWISDLDHRPDAASLAKAARGLGCPTLQGGSLLVHAAARTFQLVTGRGAHTAHMLGDFADLMAEPAVHS
ncbi:shikimate dehydrogenase [Streptomyces fuscichromogenes]|uniref:Shikimate dehydrogenase (NADP(+)) n=1 Tax=Streptomyces fuscichromogenes TaxID=1324013 RepID=A0A917UHZ2_9ACTN|nr:shikimate dehydrogenase [Streptomyces fuscichromogenes]GGM96729.1 shikimate dehydrogenase (NADP(+)) [Streptomyces fuscichromogenes]